MLSDVGSGPTTPRRAMKPINRQSTKPWRQVTAITLMLGCSPILIGCKTHVVVIPRDRAVVRLEPNRPYSLVVPGWFVPDARMQEILNELGRRVEALEKPK